MRLITLFRDILSARKLRKFGCKVAGGISKLGGRVQLIIEPNVSFGHVKYACETLMIGTNTYIRSGSELHHVSLIGRYCSIANGALLGVPRQQHPTDWLSTSLYRDGLYTQYQQTINVPPLEIGHDCWIGRDACILDGIKIGNGAIIAARAVVTSDVPSYAIVAGAPARVLRYRFDHRLIDRLEGSRWWDQPETLLMRLDFSKPENALSQ